MAEVKRTIRITTVQKILKDVPPEHDNFPMRRWSIQISMLNAEGKEVPATIFDKVTYHLHPTFVQPIKSVKKPPFRIEEQGWGEFDIPIALTLIERAGERKIAHDLNFREEKYIVDHTISIPTSKPGLNRLLAETGPMPDDSASAGEKRKNGTPVDASRTKKTKSAASKGGVDLERLAEGLTKLSEDDLLGVVQMVNDNRTPEMNIKNDVEGGEFTMDLYTLPDQLLKSLFEYVTKRAQ